MICLGKSMMFLMLVFLAAPVHAAEPQPKALNFEPYVEPYGQIYPAFELSSKWQQTRGTPQKFLIGDALALMGANVRLNVASTVSLKISSDHYLLKAVLQTPKLQANKNYRLQPRLEWRESALLNNRKVQRIPMHFELFANEKLLQKKTLWVDLRASSEVIYAVRDATSGRMLDFNWLYAAFVEEKSPLVDKLLKQSLQSGIVEQFHGASDDVEESYAQAFAIWHRLRLRGMQYSNLPPVKADRVYAQHVRFVEETWKLKKANCVDGSVLFASLLKRAGFKPVLVVLPGHMLVGFALDPDGQQYAYLETTQISAAKTGENLGQSDLDESLANFELALAEGGRQVEAAGDAFDAESDLRYQKIDIDAARRLGVPSLKR
jgi:hypothetical protein